MSPCEDPLDCLAETTKGLTPYEVGKGSRTVMNRFYGSYYDAKADQYYDCMHNEVYFYTDDKYDDDCGGWAV